MNKLILLGVLLYLVLVNARHYGGPNEAELGNEEETLNRPNDYNSPTRHRRRRWQMNYGYDYPPPSYHYPDRREYDRNQEVLQNIYKLLEDIALNVRRAPPPPPPPQPIYIPYPVPYPFPQVRRVSCKPTNTTSNPDIINRGGDMIDSNQNWGLVVSEENEYDDNSDGARPISFEPIMPKRPTMRPAPKVEHGSVQASATLTTRAPFLMDTPVASTAEKIPGLCTAGILSCCGMSENKSKQQECFANIGCGTSYDGGNACSPASIQRAIESFRVAYSPSN